MTSVLVYSLSTSILLCYLKLLVKYYQVEERDSIWIILSVVEMPLTFELKGNGLVIRSSPSGSIGNSKSRTSVWFLAVFCSGLVVSGPYFADGKAETVGGEVTWFH